MKLRGKNILIVSPESWDHVFVSKHHYAIELAKRGNNVFFLNPPSIFDRLIDTEYKDVFVLDYSGFIAGLRFFPFIVRKYFQEKTLKKLESMAGTTIDIIWSFDNSVFFDFDSFSNRILKINHIVDLNQNFQTKRAATSATLCFGVIPQIVERQRKYNANAYLIRHGVSSTSFQKSMQSVQLPGVNATKALYVGNLYMPYIDWPLFTKLANIYSDIDFVFLGNNKHLINKAILSSLSSLENVHFVDRVPSSELFVHLMASDILMLAYTPDYYNVYASPHKLMEYISTGKPVVASYTFGYDRPSELIYQAKNKTEWLSQFSFVVENLKECSSDQKAKIRKQFALENTYEKQIERIEKLIEDI